MKKLGDVLVKSSAKPWQIRDWGRVQDALEYADSPEFRRAVEERARAQARTYAGDIPNRTVRVYPAQNKPCPPLPKNPRGPKICTIGQLAAERMREFLLLQQARSVPVQSKGLGKELSVICPIHRTALFMSNKTKKRKR